MRLKGVSLPVNSVIIISLGVMVLLIIAAFVYTTFFRINVGAIDSAWSNGCRIVQERYYCDINNPDLAGIDTGVDINRDGFSDNFSAVCKLKLHTSDIKTCAQVCCHTINLSD